MIVKCNGTTIDDSQCVLRGIEVVAASDVSNPLCGPLGAARMFAPQKGATPAMVEQLETRTMQFAQLTAAHLHRDVSTRPGAGAAGGIGFALMAYADATITSGTDVLLDLLNFDKIIDDANGGHHGHHSNEQEESSFHHEEIRLNLSLSVMVGDAPWRVPVPSHCENSLYFVREHHLHCMRCSFTDLICLPAAVSSFT